MIVSAYKQADGIELAPDSIAAYAFPPAPAARFLAFTAAHTGPSHVGVIPS